jgi:WD40 repeat protein
VSPEEAAQRPNPFVGPSPLQHGQPLYGRDRELFELRNLLIAERIVVLYSPSGAGKTSLIHAGLIETLKEAEFHVLPVISLSQPPATNGSGVANRYLHSTIRSFEEDIPDAEQVDPTELKNLLLRDYLEQRPRAPDAPATDLLIFDQFEQIVTLDPADRDAKVEFFTQVGEVLRTGDRWALFSLREDHLAGLDPYRRWIPRRLTKAFRLEFLSPQAARESIRRTALHGGVDFAEDAADQLVTDLSRVRVQQPDGSVREELGQEIEPVQLQVVCRRLWNRLPAEDERIGLDLVERYGKVGEALGEFYAESVSRVAETTGIPERDIRVWFDEHLITKRGIRGQVLQESGQSAGLDDEAIRQLIDMHVVRAEARRGAVWFELAHDRLIEPIQASNDAWYQVNLNAFQQQARLWQSQGRVSGYLLADEALVQAEQWAAHNPDGLTPVEHEYLAACQEHRRAQDAERRLRDLEAAQQLAQETQARQRAEERAQLEAEQRVAGQVVARKLRRRLLIAAGFAVVAGILLIATLIYSTQAKTLSLEVESRLLAEKALSAPEPRLKLLLGVDALNSANTIEARRVLLQELSAAPFASVWLKDSPIGDLAFSPDGAHLLAGDQSSSLGIWRISGTGTSPQLSPESEARATGIVRTVAFSADGKAFAVGGDGGLEIRDTANPANQKQVTPDDVQGVAFLPDGGSFVYGQENGSVTSVDFADDLTIGVSKTLLDPPGPGRGIDGNTIAVSSKGWTAAGLNEGIIFLWSPAGEQQEITVPVYPGKLTALSFDPDGTRLAAGDDSGGVWWWDIDGPPPENRLGRSKAAITSVAFSPDGATIAASDRDGLIALWSVKDGTRIELSSTSSDVVSSIAFHPDGDYLAAGNNDGSISLWNLREPPFAVHPPVNMGLEEVSAVAFTPDAARLAAAGKTGTIRLCGRPDGQLTCTTVRETGEPVQSLALSVRGDLLAIGDHSEKTTVLSLDGSGRTISFEMEPGDNVCGLSFAADDQFVAAAVGSTSRTGGCDRNKPGAIVLLDLVTGHWERKSRGVAVTAIASDADGWRLAFADSVVALWEIKNGGLSQSKPMLGPVGAEDLAFSPDGENLGVASARLPKASAGKVYVWEIASASDISAEVQGEQALAVDFSLDGQELASGHADGSVILWDVQRREQVGPLGSLHAEVRGLAWTEARTVLVVGAEGSLVEFYTSPELDPQRWQDRACRVAGNDFNAAEAWRYLQDKSRRVCEV